ncbi:MAG TPA: ATP-dependent zinc metalloprotease FtsH, partial [Acidimicrobiales bacterium]|nr:ATP-dependent zinc metalloprotease FtsH [Acidimicrobiales bacterium]
MAGQRRKGTRAGKGQEKKSRLGLWTAIGLALLLGAYLGVLELSRPHVDGDKLRFDTFVSLARNGEIRSAQLLDEDAYVIGTYVRDDDSTAHYNAPLVRGTQAQVLQILLDNEVPIEIDQQVGKRVAALASILLPGLILVLLFVYMILSYRRSSGLFAIRSGARRIHAEEGGVTFADVAGQDAAIAELREIKEFLTDGERFAALGAVVPKGVLLYGPPGCGKTLIARALAGETGASIYSITGSDFVELYQGVGASRVRDLFRQARETVPALIFIDELDSIGRARSTSTTASAQGEQEQALNQVLAEMDGFSPNEGIMVLGATNRPDVLDPALLRPGRFDRTVGLERPDAHARLAILSIHTKGKKLGPDVDLKAIAHKAIGMTGADLASVMNEGALLAARAREREISQARLDQALQRILEAPERQRRLSLRDRSIGKRFASDERITFADVAGVDDAVEELQEVKEYLADPERFAKMGARVPRGILLSGPPGCGKTMLARAVAGEANAAFFTAAGSEFVEIFVGQGASRVRDLFAEARSVAPAIVFIDEIDAIGGRRMSGRFAGEREGDQTLNQILVELDGFEARSGVILMAATNRPDMLDPALVRPGRIDRKVEITPPDRAGRLAILELYAKQLLLAPDVDLSVVAALSQGFSGADLANIMNEAALLATRRNLSWVTMEMIEEGIDRAILGVSSRGHVMSDEERRVVAFHEGGHALVALVLPGADPPHKVTILPRGGSLGHATTIDAHDRVMSSRSTLIDRMAVSLGGKVAEELVFGESGTGVSADLEHVARLARRMVRQYGMADALGPLAYTDDWAERGPAWSEASGRVIDAEVRRLAEEAGERAREVLVRHRQALDAVAEALLAKETLSAAELTELVGALP